MLKPILGSLAVALSMIALHVRGAESAADRASSPPNVFIEPNGTVHVPAFDLPMSEFMSDQARQTLAAELRENRFMNIDFKDVRKLRQLVNEKFAANLRRARELYPVSIDEKTLGSVHALVVTPRTGDAGNIADRVLINVHGGAFTTGDAATIGLLEAIPVAAVAKMKVVTIDYRMGPEHKFPAASEDVAAVYRELLKNYRPESIGIYGCSSGGVLTAQAVAWIAKQALPKPGAIGIFCGSAGGWVGGDSGHLAFVLAGWPSEKPAATSGHASVSNASYLSDADFNDPLVAPIRSNAVLENFPPTLIINSTRDWSLSSAVHTHAQLVKLGVEAELHVWDGLWHGFLIFPDLPEAQEAYAVIAKFFDRHLAHRAGEIDATGRSEETVRCQC